MKNRVMILLAAGTGTRLLPLTADRPKCLVELHDRTLLEWQLATFRAAGFERIVVVGGHGYELLDAGGIVKVRNPRYLETNMVMSLLAAREHFTDETFISYGDIVYEPHVLDRLAGWPSRPAVVVDRQWRPYWSERFADPLSDAETLRLDAGGRIVDIGRKPESLDEIEAQYIGLLRLDAPTLETAERLVESGGAVPRPVEKWFMTDLLQLLIDRGIALHAVPVDGGWLEIDSHRDLDLARRFARPAGNLLEIERV